MKLKMTALALIGLSLAACSSNVDTTNPIGVGTGPNSLKLSPCAKNDVTQPLVNENISHAPKIG